MKTCDRCSQDTDTLYRVIKDSEVICPNCAEDYKDEEVIIED